MTLQEMLDERNKCIKAARDILDSAKDEKGEKRNLTGEEQKNYDQAIDDASDWKQKIENEQREIALKQIEEEAAESMGTVAGGPDIDGDGEGRTYFASKEYRTAFGEWLKNGASIGDEVRKNVIKEVRALQMDVDISGGYLVMPEQMAQGLLKNVDDMVFVRQYATKFQVPNAASLGAVSLDADPDDATWTTELKTASEDTAMAFGKRELHPHPFAKLVKISKKLIRTVPNVESLVNGRLTYKHAITEEKAYLTGSGSGQPLGVFTASNDGVPTSRDVSTGNTDTEITFDGLINAKYSIKSQYWPRLRWAFHRDAMKMITKIKDGEGRYMWRESVRVGEPDMLFGHPIDISEYVPNTYTTGLYAGILADWSYYWIADALSMTVQTLVELYATTNQNGYITRQESDGMPVLSEMFSRIKLA